MTRLEMVDLLTNKAVEEMHFFCIQDWNDRVYFYFDNNELKFTEEDEKIWIIIKNKILSKKLNRLEISYLEKGGWKKCFLDTLKEKMAVINEKLSEEEYNTIKNILFYNSAFDKSNCKYNNDKEVVEYYCKGCKDCKDCKDDFIKRIINGENIL